MTLIQGCLAIATGNIGLLEVLGHWNSDLHWAVAVVAMLFLVIAWVIYWDEDIKVEDAASPATDVGRRSDVVGWN